MMTIAKPSPNPAGLFAARIGIIASMKLQFSLATLLVLSSYAVEQW